MDRPTGRPTFKIDQKILRGLRNDKTLLEIAKELHKSLGKKYTNTTNDQGLASSYQRIEKTGQTSRKRAEALAAIFKVSVRVLQGLEPPEPLEYLKKIVNLLNEQVQKGENEVLRHELKSYENSSDSTDKSIEKLAENFGARIEASQFSRNPSEIAELKALTGLSETELLDPANVLGHWLIIVSSRTCNRTEIVQGETRLINLIADLLDDYLASSPSDSSIRMSQDMPWCRMEIERAGFSPRLMRIDFTRCHPFEDKGIRWGITWKNQYILRALESCANSIVNFVTSFDGKQAPSQLHRLRLIVTGKGLDEVDGEMKVITGHLDEIPEEWIAAGQSHYLVQNGLISDLKTFILPCLQRYPAEFWMIHRIGNNSINMVLIPESVQTLPSSDMSFYGHKYRIQLVEENVENKFDPVPWRIEDMDELIKKIENWIVSSSE